MPSFEMTTNDETLPHKTVGILPKLETIMALSVSSAFLREGRGGSISIPDKKK